MSSTPITLVGLPIAAAATLGSDWSCIVKVEGVSGVVALDPAGSETIDGIATLALAAGSSCVLASDGSSGFVTALRTNLGSPTSGLYWRVLANANPQSPVPSGLLVRSR